MTLTRRTFISASAALTVMPAFARVQISGSLEQVVQRHTEARGGAVLLDRVLTYESAVRVTEPTFQVNGRYLASTEGQVRVDVYADGARVFSEGVDADGVWGWSGGAAEPEPSGELGRQALLHGIEYNLVGLHRYPERGQSLVLVDPEIFAGIERHVVEVAFDDGFETRLYIDPQTWMIVGRRDRRAYHPDFNSTEKRIESRYSDFREVESVKIPFLSEDYDMDTGQRIGRSEVFWVKINPDLGGRMPRTAPPQEPPPTSL